VKKSPKIFHTQNPKLGTSWSALEWKMLLYFIVIWNVDGHLVHFMDIWKSLWSFGNFSSFGRVYQEKTGNPALGLAFVMPPDYFVLKKICHETASPLMHPFPQKQKKFCGLQGCQLVYFQTENQNLGLICSDLEWKMLSYFMTI
jgi:hypothetical protein